jgi:predicted transcriptional regulator of viral defense system
MMCHLDRRYYVGLLSAAELHGVAHQRPQVFQVVVDRQLLPRRVGRTEMRFYTSGKIRGVPTVRKTTPTGEVLVSSVEATVLDLAFRPVESGGIDNVATVIGELVEERQVDVDALAAVAEVFPASALRRVGWMLERVCGLDVADRISAHDAEPTMLDPHGSRRGPIDPTWKVIVNTDVVADL